MNEQKVEEFKEIVEELTKGIFLVFGDTEICIRLKYGFDAYLPIQEQICVKVGGKTIDGIRLEDFKNLAEISQKVYEKLKFLKEQESE